MPTRVFGQAAPLFGSDVRDRLLKLLALTPETHVREAARALGVSPTAVWNAVRNLEASGAVASRVVGTSRVVALDPRWYAATELRALLRRTAPKDSSVVEASDTLRHRPRRIGKPM